MNKHKKKVNMGADAWNEYLDEESGDLYYYNKNTGETTWNKSRTKNEMNTAHESGGGRELSVEEKVREPHRHDCRGSCQEQQRF